MTPIETFIDGILRFVLRFLYTTGRILLTPMKIIENSLNDQMAGFIPAEVFVTIANFFLFICVTSIKKHRFLLEGITGTDINTGFLQNILYMVITSGVFLAISRLLILQKGLVLSERKIIKDMYLYYAGQNILITTVVILGLHTHSDFEETFIGILLFYSFGPLIVTILAMVSVVRKGPLSPKANGWLNFSLAASLCTMPFIMPVSDAANDVLSVSEAPPTPIHVTNTFGSDDSEYVIHFDEGRASWNLILTNSSDNYVQVQNLFSLRRTDTLSMITYGFRMQGMPLDTLLEIGPKRSKMITVAAPVGETNIRFLRKHSFRLGMTIMTLEDRREISPAEIYFK
jgi:hypothetical protein